MMKAKQHSQYRDAKEILNSMASKLLDAENENNANIPPIIQPLESLFYFQNKAHRLQS